MEGTLKELGGGLYTYTRPLTGYGGSVNGSLLVLPGEALVVDTLCSPKDMDEFAALIGSRPTTVVYTHADWDHCLGTGGLKPERVIAHELTAQRLTEEGQSTLDDLTLKNPELVSGASVVLPDTTFRDTFTIPLSGCLDGEPGKDGSLTAELIHMPGHTGDSCVCWIPKLGVLIAGDAVEDPFPSVTLATNTGLWADKLEELGKTVSLVIPGHGNVSGPQLIAENVRYLRGLMGAARRNTPHPWLTPDVSLETLDPGAAKRISRMSRSDQAFYKDVHEENVRRVLSVL